ncbi:MAG TPA: TM2 domain-containing protein [Bacteroidia bacterium]|nr:TM2 domain-containing protein [Bacteroidia bacterium]
MKYLVFIVCVLLSFNTIAKTETATIYYLDSTETIISFENITIQDKKPNPIFQLFRKKQKLNKKITAAVLAFPFPFGMVGLHRIYLGTKPYVPVAYIATLGGVFGILPLIDFFAITCDKNFDQYRDNGKVFMWIKE